MNHFPRQHDFQAARDRGSLRPIADGGASAQCRDMRIALIGTYAPRRCGIATFTADIACSLRDRQPGMGVDVYAVVDRAGDEAYEGVAGTILPDDPESMACAARRINETGVDAVWLQHEYGIYGDDDGQSVCALVDQLAAPLVVTLHTVLREPSERQRAILQHLVRRSSRIMVMSAWSRTLLESEYGAPPGIVAVVEHGAPDRPFGRQEEFKARLGIDGRKVVTTFGLLGPGKGLETVIRALPAIVSRHPQVVYRIVGATHPNLVAREGEAYRQRLQALAQDLGVDGHLMWENRFLDTDVLLDQLEASDIYVTPYPGLQQSTSGTLSYAVALGKAVVSTPFAHARELLADDVGVLIAPNSHEALADAVIGLLDDPEALAAMQRRAWLRGRDTTWPRFADAAMGVLSAARAPRPAMPPRVALPGAIPGLTALRAMSDGTGMLQHAIGVVPDRRHGYCLDDNARALMLMNAAQGVPAAERIERSMTYAAFIEAAWNADRGRFRNFMRFDRTWAEDEGSEDSNGRAMWALGHACQHAADEGLASWAIGLFERAAPMAEALAAPRAIAFAVLGGCAVLRAHAAHQPALRLVERGGDLLMRLLGEGRCPGWAWFEAMLGYDNPRLSQALVEAGCATGDRDWMAAGLDSLRWISSRQVSARGQFRPIGSETFGKPHAYLPFDQQPLEAQAAIEAARAGWIATGDPDWLEHARIAWRWFFGGNDRGCVLADIATGRCRDGVTPRGVNENCGAESILAFHLSHLAMMDLARAASVPPEGGVLEQA